MPHPMLNRDELTIRPLRERANKVVIRRDHVPADAESSPLPEPARAVLDETAERIRRARIQGRPVILAFGAHTVKNGLSPVLIRLMEEGWLTHLATNGAGIIHDWEFAFQGESSEDVRANVAQGRFGLWEETGYYLNLALIVGAYETRGYGESVGALIETEGLHIPSAEELRAVMRENMERDPERCAAAADLCQAVTRFSIPAGRLRVTHPFKSFSAQAAAYRLGVPFTGHPMIGHDIIYTHPMNMGSAVGRTALRDFLVFAHSVRQLDGGVYLSVGSAVMSPMIFEKAMSMAQNLHIRRGGHIDGHFIVVADLAPAAWDWEQAGEPPPDQPAYYLRYAKTFSRMGGRMRYVTLDNRDFLLALRRRLAS